MSRLCAIAWSEGMYLSPHHFQAQARFFEQALHFTVGALWPNSHGFTDWSLDADSLANGVIAINHVRGILPDGLIFDVSADDPEPRPLAIADVFPPGEPSLTIHLGVPAYVEDGWNCDLEASNGHSETRLSAVTRMVADHNSGKDLRQVQFGRSNLRLMSEFDSSPDCVSLPLARVIRDGAGRFAFDRSFIPPCLRVCASAGLSLLVQNLIQKLEHKSDELSAGRKNARQSIIGFAGRDVAGFWLLHTVNSGLAALRRVYDRKAHPQDVFVEMLRLAGALCAFNKDSSPQTLPVYDHLAPGSCFFELERRIRKDIDVLLPENCLVVPLRPESESYYLADIADARVFHNSRWILSLRSAASLRDVLRAPDLLKVCSAEFVPELVRRALPGLELIHLPSLPPELVPVSQTEYFEVRKGGPCWDHAVKTRRVGVFVPAELPEPELQMLIVQDSRESAV